MIYKKDIKVWTKDFAVMIIKFTFELKRSGVEYSLRDQLLRSGTSVGSNVKEAKASSSRRELIRYYEIALRSGDETEYWLDVIRSSYEMNNKQFEILNSELKQIMNVIARIIINLKK